MPKIHKIIWTNDDICIIQVENELLVAHDSCVAVGPRDEGRWMMKPVHDDLGWWMCTGTGCEYKMWQPSSRDNRCEISNSKRDIQWWVAQWARVSTSRVEVSIGE